MLTKQSFLLVCSEIRSRHMSLFLVYNGNIKWFCDWLAHHKFKNLNYISVFKNWNSPKWKCIYNNVTPPCWPNYIRLKKCTTLSKPYEINMRIANMCTYHTPTTPNMCTMHMLAVLGVVKLYFKQMIDSPKRPSIIPGITLDDNHFIFWERMGWYSI